jgi:carbon storage regulator CsrA
MLLLSRRLNEKVVLPDLGISVQVVALKGHVVRLGIEAPPGVSVLRQERVGKTPAPVTAAYAGSTGGPG